LPDTTIDTIINSKHSNFNLKFLFLSRITMSDFEEIPDYFKKQVKSKYKSGGF
jgi:hypothetical protein